MVDHQAFARDVISGGPAAFLGEEPGIPQAPQGLAGGQAVDFIQIPVGGVVDGARLAHHYQRPRFFVRETEVFEAGQPSDVFRTQKVMEKVARDELVAGTVGFE